MGNGQVFSLYQAPAGTTTRAEQLNKEISKAEDLTNLESIINKNLPRFSGELVIVANIKGTPPFLWIMDQHRRINHFKAPMLADVAPRMKLYSDLDKVYFRDTIVIVDSFLVDITEALDFSSYNFQYFYLKSRQATDSIAQHSGTYRIPVNKYKKLNIKPDIFGKDLREYMPVELYNERLPDKLYGSCILYIPSQAFKNDLLNKARFLRDNSGFTLPDIAGVISMDLQRHGTVFYKPLLSWLRYHLAPAPVEN